MQKSKKSNAVYVVHDAWSVHPVNGAGNIADVAFRGKYISRVIYKSDGFMIVTKEESFTLPDLRTVVCCLNEIVEEIVEEMYES